MEDLACFRLINVEVDKKQIKKGRVIGIDEKPMEVWRC